MNEVLNAIRNRRSIRKFKPDMVDKELIQQVIEAGLYAASGRGKQCPIVLAVPNKEVRNQLSEMNRQIGGWEAGFDPFYHAPVVLLVLAPKESATYLYDGSLVMGNMMLAAHSLGLGSCWIHRAKEEFETGEGQALLKSLGIEGDYEGIGHCVLGYIEGEYPNPPERKKGRTYYMD